MAKILPNKSIDEIQNFVDENSIEDVLGYRTKEHNNIRVPQPAYLTGYPNTEEILISIIKKVKDVLLNYPSLKLESIKIVVSDIIRYVYHTLTMDKSFFPELYDPNEKLEKTFQNSLSKFLKHTSNCRFYDYEKSVVGRVDIFFRDNNIAVPIEVKKTKKIIDFDSIKKDYLAQAQTYAQPYDQIGFLVVFDISEKTKPINPISSLFELITIEPEYKLNNGIADYIVVAIVPANKQLPSSMTTY